MRLIDADVLKKNIAKWLIGGDPQETVMVKLDDIAVSVIMEIDEQPTVIELSCQCKDCIYWADDVAGYTEHVKHCLIGNYMIGKNGFCVYGEKKKDDWKESVMNHFTKVE